MLERKILKFYLSLIAVFYRPPKKARFPGLPAFSLKKNNLPPPLLKFKGLVLELKNKVKLLNTFIQITFTKLGLSYRCHKTSKLYLS